jgi:hypothetical protein
MSGHEKRATCNVHSPPHHSKGIATGLKQALTDKPTGSCGRCTKLASSIRARGNDSSR